MKMNLVNIMLLRQKYSKYFEEKVNFNSVLSNRDSVESTFNFIKSPKIKQLSDLIWLSSPRYIEKDEYRVGKLATFTLFVIKIARKVLSTHAKQ